MVKRKKKQKQINMIKRKRSYSGRGHPDWNDPRNANLKRFDFAYGSLYATSEKDALKKLKRSMKR
jgi:hypothetical protein